MNIARRSSSHGNVAGDGLEAQFGTGRRPRHILEFRQGADAILRTVMCDPISAVRYMARWTGTLWRRTICLGTRWRLRLTLTRLTFTTKPSEAEVCVGPCEVFTGASLHVDAEHYRESRSEAHPASLCIFIFIARLLSIPFIDPNPSDDREWELIVAHFGPFNNAERCLLGTLE
jgi:hypothetical protein